MYATQAWTSEPEFEVVQVLKPGEAADVGSIHCSSVHQAPDGSLVMAEYYEPTRRWVVFAE